ncbi:hypothetical protein T265_05696 [Opisthorchis viverrini]|uniref:Integrase catalytic domain-containing protein n=1 Tax=Opisthorchis viverrini TaxID=6198 RepID=A0A074ZJR0_OPIVI|nr:hypothetical protein T265_05696 [Opisthorchis viverrini]KER27231.1 hypothetical protein T265_05696 [Opisthorchis viverrini]
MDIDQLPACGTSSQTLPDKPHRGDYQQVSSQVMILPHAFPTTSPSTEFPQQALRKVFGHEGVPTVLVTDNGTHFTAKFLEERLKGLRCRHLFTAPRHPQSNGLAENFVRTLKSAIIPLSPTTFVELDRGIDNFLMQYRNAVHSVSGKSPALLFKSHSLHTSLDCAKTTDVKFYKGNDLRPATGIVLSSDGNQMVTILDLDDLSCHRRHIDQVEFNSRGQSVNGTPAASNTNESFVDDLVVSDQNVSEERTTCEESEVFIPIGSERLRSRPPLDYKRPHAHSSSSDPKLMTNPIVVIPNCASESGPTKPAASPDSSFYSTTTGLSPTKGSDDPEEANLTCQRRPKYVELSTLISVTDNTAAAMRSSTKPQTLKCTESGVRGQGAKPTSASLRRKRPLCLWTQPSCRIPTT